MNFSPDRSPHDAGTLCDGLNEGRVHISSLGSGLDASMMTSSKMALRPGLRPGELVKSSRISWSFTISDVPALGDDDGRSPLSDEGPGGIVEA